MNYKKLALALLVLFALVSSVSYGYFMNERYEGLVNSIKRHESIPYHVKDELVK